MKRLKIAIQKSGRLNEGSLKLLKDCGIFIDNGKDQLKAPARNFPLELLFLRNSDIPQYVEDGIADAAIIGENILIEKSKLSGNLDLPVVACRWPYQKMSITRALNTLKERGLPPPIPTPSKIISSRKMSNARFMKFPDRLKLLPTLVWPMEYAILSAREALCLKMV